MEVKTWLEPLLLEALTHVQPETAEDWYQCYSEISVCTCIYSIAAAIV